MSVRARRVPPIPSPGFADQTRDSQKAFRAILDALAHPTRVYPLAGPSEPPVILGPGLAAVALTVLDEECSVWLGGELGEDAEVAAWLAFHTGVRVVTDPAEADFIFTEPAAQPPYAMLRNGSEEAPHHSATVVLDIRGLNGCLRFRAHGPGIDGATDLDAVWADGGFGTEWDRNSANFPRGVDLLIVGEDTIAALPRTTRLTPTDSKKGA